MDLARGNNTRARRRIGVDGAVRRNGGLVFTLYRRTKFQAIVEKDPMVLVKVAKDPRVRRGPKEEMVVVLLSMFGFHGRKSINGVVTLTCMPHSGAPLMMATGVTIKPMNPRENLARDLAASQGRDQASLARVQVVSQVRVPRSSLRTGLDMFGVIRGIRATPPSFMKALENLANCQASLERVLENLARVPKHPKEPTTMNSLSRLSILTLRKRNTTTITVMDGVEEFKKNTAKGLILTHPESVHPISIMVDSTALMTTFTIVRSLAVEANVALVILVMTRNFVLMITFPLGCAMQVGKAWTVWRSPLTVLTLIRTLNVEQIENASLRVSVDLAIMEIITILEFVGACMGMNWIVTRSPQNVPALASNLNVHMVRSVSPPINVMGTIIM